MYVAGCTAAAMHSVPCPLTNALAGVCGLDRRLVLRAGATKHVPASGTAAAAAAAAAAEGRCLAAQQCCDVICRQVARWHVAGLFPWSWLVHSKLLGCTLPAKPRVSQRCWRRLPAAAAAALRLGCWRQRGCVLLLQPCAFNRDCCKEQDQQQQTRAQLWRPHPRRHASHYGCHSAQCTGCGLCDCSCTGLVGLIGLSLSTADISNLDWAENRRPNGACEASRLAVDRASRASRLLQGFSWIEVEALLSVANCQQRILGPLDFCHTSPTA